MEIFISLLSRWKAAAQALVLYGAGTLPCGRGQVGSVTELCHVMHSSSL